MDQVATHYFTVPLAEAPMMYDGGFISVSLAKPAYAPGESIRLIVHVWTWTSARWFDIWWGSIIIAYDAVGRELTRVAASHLAIPGVDDYEEYDVDLNLGIQPPEGLSGRLELWCEGSPAVLVATAPFSVPTDEVPPPPPPPPPVEKPFPWWAVGLGLGGLGVIVALAAAKKR